MFQQLLESRRMRHRSTKWAAVSTAFHAGLIATAAVATARQTVIANPEPPIDERVVYSAPVPVTPPSTRSGSSGTIAVPQLRVPGFIANVVPLTVDVELVDYDAGIHDLANRSAISSSVGSGVPRSRTAVFFALEVERVVQLRGHVAPEYPRVLRAAGVEGEVLLEFVVDTLGVVEPGSINVLRATHAGFAESARRWAAGARFSPAAMGRSPVRQLVRQPLVFNLRNR